MARIQVKDIMCKDLKACVRNTSLQDVAQMMVEADCGAIPVVESFESMHPVGMITDRDIAVRLLAKGSDPLGKRVADCMTHGCVTVRDNSSLSRCLRIMESRKVRRAIVVDDRKKCIGVIAQADIATHGTDGKIARFMRAISHPMRSYQKDERVA